VEESLISGSRDQEKNSIHEVFYNTGNLPLENQQNLMIRRI
jgi:hypothetical protein